MKIPQDVLVVLSSMEVDGLVARFPAGDPLDRKLYLATNKVLEELGGKWTRGKRGHVFETDPAARLDDAIVSGEIATAREAGFFPTPIALAKRLVELAGVRPGMSALEPSAGTGRIVMALQRAGANPVVAVESDLERIRALLTVLGTEHVRGRDFLSIRTPGVIGGPFDCVAMNPPFARQADIDHVRHAYSFLKLGGRLASIMSAGVTFRQDRKATEFRALVSRNHGTIEALPDDSFKESGTSVNTMVVTMVKPITVESVIESAR